MNLSPDLVYLQFSNNKQVFNAIDAEESQINNVEDYDNKHSLI